MISIQLIWGLILQILTVLHYGLYSWVKVLMFLITSVLKDQSPIKYGWKNKIM